MNSSSSRREKAGASRLFSWLLCPALVLAIAMGLGLLPPAALWTLLGLPLLRAFEVIDQVAFYPEDEEPSTDEASST